MRPTTKELNSRVAYEILFLFFGLYEVETTMTTTTAAPPTTTQKHVECVQPTETTVETSTKVDWLEMEVAAGFRVWQLMFLALAGLIALIVLLCCCMKCRIPRTKQEIEADFVRKKLTRRFRGHLNKLPMDDINFKAALEKVRQLCGDEESPKKSEKALVSREGSQEKKLTFMQRLKKFLEPVDQNRDKEEEEEEDEEKKETDEESKSEEDDQGSNDQVKLELDS